MAFVHDSESIARLEVGNTRDAHRQDIQDTITQTTLAEVRDYENSPTNPLRQWGRSMTTEAFETKLKRILPSFCKIFPHPTDVTKHCLYLILPGGEQEFLTAWENPIMPEFAVCYEHWEDVPDMSVGTSDATAISRADLPPYEWNAETGEFDFDTTHQPLAGMKRVRTVGGVALKGWRAALMSLVALLVITPTQAELTFGSCDRKEWAHIMGKQKNPTPWCS
jgi:hypothetical protein